MGLFLLPELFWCLFGHGWVPSYLEDAETCNIELFPRVAWNCPHRWQYWTGPFFYFLKPSLESRASKYQALLPPRNQYTQEVDLKCLQMCIHLPVICLLVATWALRFVAFLVPAGYVDDAPLNLSNIHTLEICSLSRRQCLGALFIVMLGDVIPLSQRVVCKRL